MNRILWILALSQIMERTAVTGSAVILNKSIIQNVREQELNYRILNRIHRNTKVSGVMEREISSARHQKHISGIYSQANLSVGYLLFTGNLIPRSIKMRC
jgi:hypothetical protein